MRECKTCGNPTSNPKFCSKSCSAKAQHKNNKTGTKKKINFYCAKCGVEIGYRRKYCKEHIPNKVDWSEVTLGELRSRRKHQAHSRVREHARSLYKKSDKPKHCIHCKYDKHYDVCHIKDICDYPDDAKVLDINDLNNLIALCKNHHWEFDNGILKINNLKKDESSHIARGCLNCGKKIIWGSTRCRDCDIEIRIKNSPTASEWPDIKTLILQTCASSYSAMSRRLDKTDVAVKKRIISRLDMLLKKEASNI